jgi:hypothetical protein
LTLYDLWLRFIRGNDRISQLAQRPDLAEGVAQVRRDMEDADRTYAMGLAALRHAAELTQVELAKRMGVTQAAVSRMNSRTTCSCLLSTPTLKPWAGTPA